MTRLNDFLKRPFRVLVIGASVVAVLTATAMALVQYLGARATTANGTPLLLASPAPRFTDHRLEGHTATAARVQLYVGSTLAAVTSSSLVEGSRGPRDKRLPPSYPYAFSFDLSELAPFFDQNGDVALVATAQDAPFTTRDFWSSAPPPILPVEKRAHVLVRDVSVTMAPDRIRYHARLVFARDDPVIRLFLDREIEPDRLLARTLAIGVDQIPLGSIAIPSTMRVLLAPDTIAVSVNGDSAARGYQPAPLMDRSFQIVRGGVAGESHIKDTLRIRMAEYRIDSADPLPVRSGKGGYAVWYGSAANPAIDVYVTPTSANALRSARAWVSAHGYPRDLFWAMLRQVVSALLVVVPLVIGMVLLRQADEQHASDRSLLAIILTVSLMPTGSYLIYQLFNALRPRTYDSGAYVAAVLERLRDPHMQVEIVFGLGMIVLLSAVAVVLCRIVARVPLRIPLATLAISYTSIIAAVVLSIFIQAIAHYPELLANGISAVAATVLGVTVVVRAIHPRLVEDVVNRVTPRHRGIFAAAAVLAVVSLTVSPFLPKPADQASTTYYLSVDRAVLDVQFGLGLLAQALYLSLFLVLSPSADAMKDWNRTPRWIAVMCAAFVVGAGLTILAVPLGFIAALFAFSWIALSGTARLTVVDAIRAALPTTDADRIAVFQALRDAKTIDDTMKKLNVDLLSGSVKPADHQATLAELTTRRAALAMAITVPAAARPADIAFGFGLSAEPRTNGVIAAKFGLVVGLVFLLVTLPSVLSELHEGSTLFSTLLRAVAPLAARVSGAFLFGYFFASWRGTMGTTKALFFALAAIVSTLVVTLFTSTRAELLSSILSLLVFYGAIGVWFDARSFLRLGIDMQPRELMSLAGVGNFAALGTLGLTTLGTILTGQLKTLAPLFLKSFFPGAPGGQ